jgi:hypothetical protein
VSKMAFPEAVAICEKRREGLTLQIICKWRAVLNDGLHEQCCCRMVARLRHLSPICPPCVRTRDRRLGTGLVVDDVSQQLRT